MMDAPALMSAAIEARKKAYTPYSGFAVGAALLDADGKVFTGCNVENAAYTPTNCAERTAFFKAVSEGSRRFVAIAVVGGAADRPLARRVTPCGVCRQVMAEFCDADFLILTGTSPEDYQTDRLGDLLPQSFGPQSL